MSGGWGIAEARSAILIGAAISIGACDATGGRVPAEGGSSPLPAASPVFITAGSVPDEAIRGCIGDPGGWSAREELEPHVASAPRDPDHLIAAWMARAGTGPGGIQAAASRDGGRTWSAPVTLPFGACAGGAPEAVRTSDPWVGIDSDGRGYVAAIGWDAGEDGVDRVSLLQVAASADGGERWAAPVIVSDMAVNGVRLDNTAIAASAEVPGLAYVASTRYVGDAGPPGVARTEDGGLTWTRLLPAPVPSPEAPWALAPQPLVGPGDDVWVIFGHDPRGARVGAVRSDDRGRTWSAPRPVAAWDPPRGWPRYPGTDRELAVAPDIVAAAIDPTTSALWVAHAAPTPEGSSMIRIAGSVDGGIRWVDSGVSPEGETGWRPSLAVRPGGPLALAYFRPDDPLPDSGATALPTAVDVAWLQPGADGSARTVRRVTVDRFDWVPRRGGAYFLGDYHGIAMAREAAVAVFSRSTPDGARVVAARVPAPPISATGADSPGGSDGGRP